MINSLAQPLAPMTQRPRFWREILGTTLSYVAWGYGALLFSFAGYGFYALFKWLPAKDPSAGFFLAFALTAFIAYLVYPIVKILLIQSLQHKVRARTAMRTRRAGLHLNARNKPRT